MIQRIIFLNLLIVSIGLSSCNKDVYKMEVVRDCTGVYLRENGTDHYVCNSSVLSSFATGDKIKVQYDVLVECFGLIESSVCMLYHEYQDKIEVTSIE